MRKKQKKLFILAILTGFFIIFIVGAIQITTFTNSLSSENLTFTGDENITRYLEIPKNADVTSGYLNLSGYKYDYCYQESVNTSNQTGIDGDCNLDYTGNYLLNSWASGGTNTIDGNWETKDKQFAGFGILHLNYTKPNCLGYGSIWTLKDAIGNFNITIPLDCWNFNANKIELEVVSIWTPNHLIYYCMNNSGWKEIAVRGGSVGQDYFYEEGMWWNISAITNPYLEIGTPDGTYEWNHSGEFNSTFSPNKTSNFSSTLNTALNSGACDCTGCSLSDNNCTIPFLFHSDTAGILEYSAIDINYNNYPFVILESPDNNTWSSAIKTFNCSATDEIQLSNITFNFWNSTGDLNLSITKNLTGISNSTTYEMTFNSTDTFYWNCEATNNNSKSWWADDNFTINVNIENPIITLNKPTDNQYINTANVQFNYTLEHSTQTIDTCQLWGNFTGAWALNQSNSSITENVINTFNQTLPEGMYLWNIRCNSTTVADFTFAASNFTFILDTTNPNLTINQPSGTKTSKTISYNVSASDDLEMNTCLYWVMRGASEEISNTTITCNSSMAGSFIVSSDLTSYVFHFFVNDSAGNSNSSSSAFNVDTTAIVDGGGAMEEEEEEIIEVSICIPFKDSFFQSWENAKQEENIFEKIKTLWNSWWNYIICSSAASIVPI